MIGIRSVTYQLPKEYTKEHIARVAKLSRIWDRSYHFIRTQRVCTCPYTQKVNLAEFRELSNLCDISSVRWFNVPIDPLHSENAPELFGFAHSVLAEYGRAFVNVLGVADGEIRTDVLEHSAELMRKVSALSVNGKDNFRLGMSVNVRPDGPFFPFTYSSGEFGFSIALELTQQINEICIRQQNASMAELRTAILDCLIPQIEEIDKLAAEISEKHNMKFKGFDFSLAPIIGENGSVITILNALGVYNFGKTGTLFATGFITNILKHLASRFKAVGFSGVMYSLLEDLDLCAINNQRGVSLEQLISLSTMCGCGIDMVPVYGNIKNDEMLSMFLDVIGISCRLNKPLGVRILPIPNCARGKLQFTSFHDDSDFIANTKVVDLDLNFMSNIGKRLDFLETRGLWNA